MDIRLEWSFGENVWLRRVSSFDIRPETFELLANDKKTGTHSQSNRAGGLAAAFIAELATMLSVYRPQDERTEGT